MSGNIAKSLANLYQNRLVRVALDKSQSLDDVIDDLFSFWSPDLSKRKPSLEVQVVDGSPSFVTSLDFLPLLLNFAIRNSFVNIRYYDNLRPSVKKSGEKVISKENRHGYVLQINANKETHAFSILIRDFNVIERLSDGSERVGLPRKFNILDDAGRWYDGFNHLEFTASLTSGELELLKFKENVDIIFKYFVHPSRAMSIYSSGYLITKLFEDRCADEARFYRNLAAELRDGGVSLDDNYSNSVDWKFYFKRNKKNNKLSPKKIRLRKSVVLDKEVGAKDVVPVLLAKLDHPEFYGDYPVFGLSPEGKILEYEWGLPRNKNALQDILRYCNARANYLTFNVATQLRAGTRAVELAFLRFGTQSGVLQWGEEDNNPGWNVPDWQDIKIKRTIYRGLDFGNGFRLLYRLKAKEFRVKDKESDLLF